MAYTEQQLKGLYIAYTNTSEEQKQKILQSLQSNNNEASRQFMDYFNSQNSKGNQTQPPQYIYNPTSNKYEQNLQQSVAQSSINNPEQQSVVTKQPTYVYNSKTGMYEQEQGISQPPIQQQTVQNPVQPKQPTENVLIQGQEHTKATGLQNGNTINSGSIKQYDIGNNAKDIQDTSEQRQLDIVSNLNNYYKTSPELFTNYDTFTNNFGYQGRTEAQKNTLDNWWNGIEKQKEISDRANNPTNMLISDLLSGKYIMSDLYGLKTSDPQKRQEINDARNKKLEYNARLQNTKDTLDIVENKKPTPVAYSEEAKKYLDKALEDFNGYYFDKSFFYEYKSKFESGEILTQQQQIINTQNRVNEITSELYNLREKIKRDHPGFSPSMINTLYNDMAFSLNQERMDLMMQGQNEQSTYANMIYNTQQIYQTEYAKYQTEVSQWKDNYSVFMDKFGIAEQYFVNPELQRQQAIFNDDLSRDRAIFDAELKFDQTTKLAQREDQFNNPNLDSIDTTEANRSLKQTLQSYYDQYGQIIQRDMNLVLSDIKYYAKQKGISLSQALQENFVDPLKNKPEYKQITQAAIYGSSSDKWNKLNDTSLYNQATGEIIGGSVTMGSSGVMTYPDSGMKGAGLRNNNPGNIKDTTFGNVIGTDSKGFAIFNTPEEGFDALVAKIKYNQTNPSSKYYGKTIEEYFKLYAPSSDGNDPAGYSLDVANRLGVSVNTKISDVDATRLASAIAHHDSGYNSNTYGKLQGSGGAYNLEYTQLYNKINRGNAFTKEDRNTVDKLGISRDAFLKQASEYENEKQKSEEFLVAKEKLEELNYVLDNIDYLYGIYDSIDFPWATNGSTVRATLDRYINDTTLFKLIDSKSKGATFGALSDQELRLLKSSASDLQGNLNKDVFKNRLEATISALNKAINGSNTETQNIPSGYPSSAFDLLNTIAIGGLSSARGSGLSL